jgi:hypothetical protein
VSFTRRFLGVGDNHSEILQVRRSPVNWSDSPIRFIKHRLLSGALDSSDDGRVMSVDQLLGRVIESEARPSTRWP